MIDRVIKAIKTLKWKWFVGRIVLLIILVISLTAGNKLWPVIAFLDAKITLSQIWLEQTQTLNSIRLV